MQKNSKVRHHAAHANFELRRKDMAKGLTCVKHEGLELNSSQMQAFTLRANW